MACKQYRLPTSGVVADGYDATDLPRVCNVFLHARRAGALKASQTHIAAVCEMIVGALAEVAIVALVDEATGYEAFRTRNALQGLFDRYLRERYATWAATFKPEFYRLIFKLRGWVWDPADPACGPRYLAQLTRDLVYERLEAGVLEEIERRNPVREDTGTREVKHHQYLSDAVGYPALREHLAGVTAILRSSPDWPRFVRALDRAYPKPRHNVQLDFGDLPGIDLNEDVA